MTAFFVSDIHLKSPTEPKALLLERFLFRLNQQATAGGPNAPTHLFLVGDIFDLWIGSHRYFWHRFDRLVRLVRDLIRSGVEVHFFEGNHDLHLNEFWQGEVGTHVHSEAEFFDLGDKRVRVEHGDLINPEDSGYHFLRWFLRTPLVRNLALNLPERVVAAIGERASAVSRGFTSGSGAKAIDHRDVKLMIHAHAKRSYFEEPFDLIVTGHVHVRDDFIFEGNPAKQVRSVNLGSWFDAAPVFVMAENGTGATEGKFIDVSSED
jgi:UDP-2,3-diacylglucosamine hydrolase